jgi:cold-inducible RNA-binding protein
MPVRLFVGNLPYDVTEDELKTFFAPVGPLAHAFIPVDRETGKRRGFAFVEFEDRAVADEAVKKLNNQSLRGRSVSVNEARPRESGGARSSMGAGGFRPSMGGGGGGHHSSAPRSSFNGSPPPFEPRSRNFGPDAKPARNRRQPSRQFNSEEKKKGPIRERRRGRVFGFDDNYDDEGFNAKAEELEDEAVAAPEEGLEPEDEE